MRFFIIHGAYGNPDGNWFPWLKSELEKGGHEVVVPRFSTPKGQSLDSWTEAFQPYLNKIDRDTIFIGHSVGPAFILSLLERSKTRVKARFFVAPFISPLGNETFDSVNYTFYKEFNWEKIKGNCKEFYIYHSDNDPYVQVSKANEIGKKLGGRARMFLIKNGGHLNSESGYSEFPELLEQIKKIM